MGAPSYNDSDPDFELAERVRANQPPTIAGFVGAAVLATWALPGASPVTGRQSAKEVEHGRS
jgi:hypothetical protein